MSLLIFVLVVIVILALVLYALRMTPIPPPLGWICQVIAVVIAILVIAQHAGLL